MFLYISHKWSSFDKERLFWWKYQEPKNIISFQKPLFVVVIDSAKTYFKKICLRNGALSKYSYVSLCHKCSSFGKERLFRWKDQETKNTILSQKPLFVILIDSLRTDFEKNCHTSTPSIYLMFPYATNVVCLVKRNLFGEKIKKRTILYPLKNLYSSSSS